MTKDSFIDSLLLSYQNLHAGVINTTPLYSGGIGGEFPLFSLATLGTCLFYQ
jgi:hypothetical protein